MEQPIPAVITQAIRNRKGLLWVCQRYDLVDGQEPHDNSVPDSEAILRYRKDVSITDTTLASFFWEAVWLEGALSSLRSAISSSQSTSKRPIVTLADKSDSDAIITSEFLPISVLPGIIDEKVPTGSKYGAVGKRARDRIAWDLASHLSKFQSRALVVIGAKDSKDLEFLFEVLEDNPIHDLHVIIVSSGIDISKLPEKTAVDFTIWQESIETLCKELNQVGAPAADSLPEWAVRCRDKVLRLSQSDIQRIETRYSLIKESDIQPANKFSMDDLISFLGGNLSTWGAYANQIPIERAYRTATGETLTNTVLDTLTIVSELNSPVKTHMLKIPVEAGAGGTTLMRMAAFKAAERGFPTLVLRSDQIGIDQDELMAFTTKLNETAQESGIKSSPSLLLVIDVEHETAFDASQVAKILANQGRRIVILQAISAESDKTKKESKGKWASKLSCLLAEATSDEVKDCADKFKMVSLKWGLPLRVPSHNDWNAYSDAMRIETPSGVEQGKSLFWIALRFFIVEGMELTDAEKALDSLGDWIWKRVKAMDDDSMEEVVKYIAALSSFRIASPLWTVLRPVTGGAFTSSITAALRKLEGIVVWGTSCDDLNDQVLKFAHPGLASELLRRYGVRSTNECLHLTEPVVESLSSGHPGDVWLAETLAVRVLTPKYSDRSRFTKLDWQLLFYEKIPQIIRDNSKTILHHWGRCLYLSVNSEDVDNDSFEIYKSRYESAIEKLKRAVNLPRKSGRDELPSHLYNTLGTACARYAKFLEEKGHEADSVKAWQSACEAFRISVSMIPNVEAFLAFAQRLLEKSLAGTENADNKLAFVSEALEYLDEAEEHLEEQIDPDPSWIEQISVHKTRALDWLNESEGQKYIEQLKNEGRKDLAILCEARLALGTASQIEIESSLMVLESAELRGVRLNPRGLQLYLSLLRRHPKRCYDFELQLSLYKKLESVGGYINRPIELFRQAVLCYQVQEYAGGEKLFRKLRELMAKEGGPLFAGKDFLRDVENPFKPKIAQIRITRFITEWRADGYVEELGQEVPLKPRHFAPMPKLNQPVACVIRFTPYGPLAVPPKFEETRNK